MYSKMLVTALVNCLCSVDVEAFIPRKLIQIMSNFRERERESGFQWASAQNCIIIVCSYIVQTTTVSYLHRLLYSSTGCIPNKRNVQSNVCFYRKPSIATNYY